MSRVVSNMMDQDPINQMDQHQTAQKKIINTPWQLDQQFGYSAARQQECTNQQNRNVSGQIEEMQLTGETSYRKFDQFQNTYGYIENIRRLAIRDMPTQVEKVGKTRVLWSSQTTEICFTDNQTLQEVRKNTNTRRFQTT